MATSNSNHTVGHLNKATTSFVSSKEKEPGTMDLEQLQHMINCTVKKNPKAELSKTDLLRLLGYLEGELQARDVVIATLKTDRVKQMVSHARYGRLLPVNDPFAALQRDSRSATLLGTSTTSSSSADDAALLKAVTEGPMAALEAVVTQHRNSHVKLIQAMQDAEARHIKVLGELEDERRKHEHDTAQGDDITYGLEKERTRLREELEIEKQGRKKVDKELKKIQETLEEERARQKQIVLLLLAERKKLICKYVEERNKAEDLAHILSEEKGRVDSMADGLEEESRKALQMEAELEKQLALFDAERAGLRAQLQREEKRAKEMEAIVEKLHAEVDHLKKQQAEAHQVAMFQAGLVHQSPANRISSSTSTVVRNTSLSSSGPAIKTTTGAPPQTPPRSSSTTTVSSPRASPSSAPLNSATGLVVLGTSSKPIQPVTMVSSTPVQAPTTGIARAVSPATTAGGIRNVQYTLGGVTSGVSTPSVSGRTLPPAPTDSSSDLATTGRGPSNAPVTSGTSPRVAVSASAGTKVFTTTNTDGKVTFHVTTSATLPPASGNSGSLPQQPPTPKKTIVGINSIATRGVPPPVPPNKPVIPPKKSGGGSVQGSGTGPVGLNPTAVTTTTASADEGSSGPASSATGGVMLHMGV